MPLILLTRRHSASACFSHQQPSPRTVAGFDPACWRWLRRWQSWVKLVCMLVAAYALVVGMACFFALLVKLIGVG
jgi:hypothetical protein